MIRCRIIVMGRPNGDTCRACPWRIISALGLRRHSILNDSDSTLLNDETRREIEGKSENPKLLALTCRDQDFCNRAKMVTSLQRNVIVSLPLPLLSGLQLTRKPCPQKCQ